MHVGTVDYVRWIVDAMNVIGARPDGWWTNRHAARIRLVEHLERWAMVDGHPVTVVFEHPTSITSTSIRIHYAPKAGPNSADDEIVRLVNADGHNADISVVTSDATLAERVRSAGASVYPAARFRDLMDPLNAT